MTQLKKLSHILPYVTRQIETSLSNNILFNIFFDLYGNKLQYTAPQRKRESKLKSNQRILLLEKKRNIITEKK
jgi:hypothetical protein